MRALKPIVRARTLDGFAPFVRELGGDPAQILRCVGIAPDATERPLEWISFPAVLRAYEVAATETWCKTFGLQLGTIRQLGFLGPLQLIVSCGARPQDRAMNVPKWLPRSGLSQLPSDARTCLDYGPLTPWSQDRYIRSKRLHIDRSRSAGGCSLTFTFLPWHAIYLERVRREARLATEAFKRK